MDLVMVLLQMHKSANERLIQLLKSALSHVCKGLVSAVIRYTIEHSDIVWFRLRRGVIADQEAACHELPLQTLPHQLGRQLLRRVGNRQQHS